MKTSNETSEMIKYLNQRYEHEGGVWRTNKDSLKDESFRAFGPTILTTRQPFQDDALESRCIHIITKETSRDDIPLNLPPKFYDEATVLRNKLLMFRLRNLTSFCIDYNLRFQGVSSRMNQILQPLGSLARRYHHNSMGLLRVWQRSCINGR